MNLGVFNKVNLKVSAEGKGMYAEWTSLAPIIQSNYQEGNSVLNKLNPNVGKEVALQVVKQLAANLGIAQAAEPSPLTSEREVQWYMEVICFGLTLPLAEHDTIRDCVNVYCEWLSALDSAPKISVPKPVADDPNLYARKIIIHFQNLFVPRKNEGADAINRQAVLCHRVLRTLQNCAQTSQILSRDTWHTLLLFLIAVNDTLLAPPNSKDDVGDQLCERILGVLFEVWLIACSKCFPSPPLWKTLRESCMKWRHHIALVEQWNRINLILTSRLLNFLYGPSFSELKISDDDAQLIPVDMSNDCIAQSWFRFLHCIGNPVNLCRPAVISQTDKFLQFAIGNDGAVDPSQHPCLNSLPLIFHRAVKGFSGLVDAFLGIGHAYVWEDTAPIGFWDKNREHRERTNVNETQTSTTTPPTQRRLAKSFSVAPSASKGMPKASLVGFTSNRSSSVQSSAAPNSGPPSTSSLTSNFSLHQDWRHSFSPNRPKCNSILHLFGEWLFEAAFIGTEHENQNSNSDPNKRSSSLIDEASLPSGSSSVSNSSFDTISPALVCENYESGRAEAIGTLCRVFCAKKTGEEILIVYLARFYLAIQHGLRVNGQTSPRECGETMASILLNSADLFKLDLDGVQVLIPAFISALEIVLPEKDLKLKSNAISRVELRRASIQILLSLLILPLHYQQLQIRELTSASGTQGNNVTFMQLKPRLMNLLINALQVENDVYNTHMLLGGLLLSVQDSAMYEMTDTFLQSKNDSFTSTSSTNLLSSASDTASVASTCAPTTISSTTTLSSNSFNVPTIADYRSLTDDVLSSNFNHINRNSNFNDLSQMLDSRQSFDSSHALFVRATYLVCHRLISSWKTDLNVSLAALELLMGLSRIHIKESDPLECKRAVKWLCDYIIYQCWRPPQAHSKDLHSTIVAAFHCCSVWLVAHPYLLKDKDCLYTALEVAELGISGTKSIGKPGESISMKDDKQLKPASIRVREAAEYLLFVIMEQVGYFPSECGAESLSSLLNEISLLKHCNLWPQNCQEPDVAIQQFRYFVVENSMILALLEEPLGNDQDPQPTVTIVIRGSFGRYAWTMQLRHLPRHKSGSKYHAPNLGRPIAMSEPTVQPAVHQMYFPESVDRISTFKIDSCIPNLDSLLTNENIDEHNQFAQLLERQSSLENAFLRKTNDVESKGVDECTPPDICNDFQTARLFLSHFGFLNFNELLHGDDEMKDVPILTALDSSQRGFWSEIENLDRMSARTCDTAHIFYVAAGQHTAEEIVSNVTHESNVSVTFLQFLTSLGWPVDVAHHPGWTGHVATSWKFDVIVPDRNNASRKNSEVPQHGGSLYNGEKQVIYWADAISEIAFVVPSKCKVLDSVSLDPSVPSASFDGSSIRNWYEDDSTKQSRNVEFDRHSSGGISDSGRRRNTTRYQLHQNLDTKILIAWLENYEDNLHLPIDDLLQCMKTGKEMSSTTNNNGSLNSSKSSDVFIIFLQELKTGLLRVHLKGPSGRMNLATPLVDGMIVSAKILGPLVRQTALNMAKRRRLDCDMYQPPHVRRRFKIQEITQIYKNEMTQPELLTSLFSSIFIDPYNNGSILAILCDLMPVTWIIEE